MKWPRKFLIIILIIAAIVYVAHLPFVNNYMDKLSARTNVEIHANDKFMAKPSHILPGYLFNFYETLNKKNNNALKYDETLIFNYRKPISKFTIYKDKYAIAVYSIDTASKISFKKDLKEEYIASDRANGIGFAINNLGALEFYFNSKINIKPSALFLKISGEQTQLYIKTDTIAYYYSKMEDLSLEYANNGPQDIYLSDYGLPIPTEILFLNRKGSLFLFIMTVKNYKTEMNPKMLYDLVVN